MGENEQGGMLRNVVVVGLVAMVALIVIFAVVGLKGNMTSTTNGATDNIQKNIKQVNDGDNNTVLTDDFTTSKYYYEFNDTNKTATISSLKSGQSVDPKLVVPSYVTKSGKKYTVTVINGYVYSHKGITSVVIPDTIISIGASAFSSNTDLTSVTFGSNVKVIGTYAFQYTKLSSVTLPDSVTSVAEQAFSDIPGNKDGFASIGKNTTYNKDSWHSSFGAHWVGSEQVGYKPTVRS